MALFTKRCLWLAAGFLFVAVMALAVAALSMGMKFMLWPLLISGFFATCALCSLVLAGVTKALLYVK